MMFIIFSLNMFKQTFTVLWLVLDQTPIQNRSAALGLYKYIYINVYVFIVQTKIFKSISQEIFELD